MLGWFVYSRRGDLALLPQYLRQVTVGNLAELASLEFLFLALAAQSNRLVYRSIGVNNSLLEQLQLLVAASTVERLLPSGGAAGMSSYVWLAHGRGIPVSESIRMTATTFVMGYLQIVPLLIVPLFWIDSYNFPFNEAVVLVVVSAGFVILAAGLALLIGSQRFLDWISNLQFVSRFPRVIASLVAGRDHVRFSWRNRRELLPPLLLLWSLYPVRIAMLEACFSAFHTQVSLPLLWAGYSLTILISFLTFLPTTLGVFELSMVGTFALLGVPTDLATAVTLLYRAFTYWLPVPLGLLAWWNLRRRVVSSEYRNQ
ncbi:hypothetical protein EFBL_1760 [Effusibacillus lacus]|uniref:Phosphatidylglycerol lysyltransferase n=2 Tax=Effusibacillus lacus TaxID=1348429 RepID=A0A292YP29_9BACL|nr:hypothetical protein EFBL_1760 [Effusibacillus lacus]